MITLKKNYPELGRLGSLTPKEFSLPISPAPGVCYKFAIIACYKFTVFRLCTAQPKYYEPTANDYTKKITQSIET